MLTPSVIPLPDRPSLDFLKDQARRLLKQLRTEDPEALALLQTFHPAFKSPGKLSIAQLQTVALHDAQLILARRHGFASWSRLKDEIEARLRPVSSREERLVRAIWAGRLQEMQTELAAAVEDTSGFKDALRRPTELSRKLRDALAGIADRSVWHRPQYRDIARDLLAVGVECTAWTAARLGLRDHVERCLDADPTLLLALDSQGRTILQRAALIYGSDAHCEETTAWLIDRGAPIDIFTASAYSLPDVVQSELRRDPSLVHRKCQCSTPLNWAVRPRRSTFVLAPSQPDQLDSKQHRIRVPASEESDIALRNGLAACELLLDGGADPESQDDQENGMHPLHHVAEWSSSEETAALLIDRGADLNAVEDRGWTPLDYALDRNRESMVVWMKQHGARQTLVDWPNTWGSRLDLLFASVQRNDLATVERLLSEDPGLALARRDSGETALHWASHDGQFEIAELLLKHGADVTAQETRHWGGTALHWAAERQGPLVDLLLRHGADINSRNERTGQTPLHYCARCDDVPEVAELLLARGARIDLRDNRGNLPLDYAIKNNHPLVAEILKR